MHILYGYSAQYIQVHFDILLDLTANYFRYYTRYESKICIKFLPSGKLTFGNGISPSSIGNAHLQFPLLITEASQLGIDSVEAWWIASTEPPSEAVERILVCDFLGILLGFLGPCNGCFGGFLVDVVLVEAYWFTEV